MSRLALRLGVVPLSVKQTKIMRGLAALRKYGANAHLWLPGLGTFNGQQIGNWLDSVGTTAASVDNPIGFVLDQRYGGGALGAEAASNPGGPFTSATGWGTYYSNLAVSGGELVSTSVATTGNGGQIDLSLIPGVTYRITAVLRNISSINASLVVQRGAAGSYAGYWSSANITSTTATPVTFYLTPTASDVQVCFRGTVTDVGQQIALSSISVRQVLGIPASQATTANKPTLRRGVTNLLTYSGDLTNAAWSKFYGTSSTVTTTLPSGASGPCSLYTQDLTASVIHRVANTSQYASGVAYTNVAILKSNGTRYVYLNAQVSQNAQLTVDLSTGAINTTGTGLSGAYTASLGNGWWWVQFNGVGSGSAGNFWLQANNALSPTDTAFTGDGTSGFFVLAAGQFTGTLTASQIQACGGIPLTTSAAASSSAGNWGWQGNGTSTTLGLPSPILALTDDCAVVAGARLDIPSGSGYYMIFAPAANSSTAARAGALTVANSNSAAAYWTNDAGTFFVSTAGTVTPGTPFVLSGLQRGGAAKARLNGGAWGNTVNPSGAATLNTGGFLWATGFNYWNGAIYPTAVVKGTVSDSDLLAIERMIGVFTGPTGVTF